MLISSTRIHHGFTLVELMVTLAIIALVFAMAAPSYSEWIQNTQVRTAAESMQAGIQLARAEALKRNGTAAFQLVTTLDASCAPSASGTNWVVSVADPSGKCDQSNSSADPFIVRTQSGTQVTKNVTFLASQPSIAFNGLGQVTPSPAATITIDIKNPTGGTCVADSGKMRCLQLQITGAGQTRMCDPAVSSTSDPRKC